MGYSCHADKLRGADAYYMSKRILNFIQNVLRYHLIFFKERCVQPAGAPFCRPIGHTWPMKIDGLF